MSDIDDKAAERERMRILAELKVKQESFVKREKVFKSKIEVLY